MSAYLGHERWFI